MKHPHTTRHHPLRACLAALLLLSALAAGRGHAGAVLAGTGEMAAVTPPADAQPPPGQLAGRLALIPGAALAMEVLRDDYGLAQDSELRIAELYNDVLLPLWQDLGLSPALADTRRSRDAARQPFTGYGLTLLRDDIARLARALNRGELDARLDTGMLAAALQRGPRPAGIFPSEGGLCYRHGFWAYDAAPLLGCNRPLALPFMSGYGGINVLLLPGDVVYYYFSDGGRFAFADALLQIDRLRPLCAQANPITRTPS